MKLLEVTRFELAYQLRQRTTWIYPVALFLLAFHLMQNFMATAREAGTPVNVPVSILNAVLVASLFGLAVVAALFGEAATRDAQTGAAPLLFSSSLREREYLIGRFLGALLLVVGSVSVIPVGALTAVVLSDPGDAVVAPFRLSSYLTPYLVIVLPNVLIAGVLLFATALVTRRVISGFVLCVGLGFGSLMIWEIVGKTLGYWTLSTYLDPLGMAATGSLLRSWSTAQRSTLGLPVEGVLLWNRILWLTAAGLFLVVVHRRFRFADHLSRTSRTKRIRRHDEAIPSAAIVVPPAGRSFGPAAQVRKTIEIAGMSFGQIVSGRVWLVPVAALVLLLIAGPELMEHIGVPLVAKAPLLLAKVSALRYDALVVLLTILYAGELVWRERDTRMHLIVDPTPSRDAVLLWGKFIGLGLAILSFQALLMLTCVGVQLTTGNAELDLPAYLRILFGYQLVDYLLFAALAIAVQVIVNQKYLAILVAIGAYAFTETAALLGIEHKLLVFGSDLGWSHSAFTGFSPAWPFLLFKLYWLGWALLLMFVARLLWVRSVQTDMKARLASARRRFAGSPTVALLVGVGLIVLAGGSIFYNTNILNDYRGDAERSARRAEYEKSYGKYEAIAQPTLEAVRLEVELYPETQAARIDGRYRLVNRTGQPIMALHLATASEVETTGFSFDRSATAVLEDHDLGHLIYELEQPLLSGEELQVGFEVSYDPRGFSNGGMPTAVRPNATYFEPSDWIPAIGYQENRRLRNHAERAAHGLPERPEVRPLEDRTALLDRAGREVIDLEVIVGTAGDQLAIAPGTLQREWREEGRRYFHYATDTPIRNLYAIFSGNYEVQRTRWRDVEIEVVHHPRHERNVERMVGSVSDSLAYFTEQFGPYPHDLIRLVEAPGVSMGLRSYPINIRYYEGADLMQPERDPRNLDFLYGVIAHEVAHQWWGNQMAPANVEGAPLLSETLAWYSAFGVVESALGSDSLDRFLGVMREAYLAPRPMADPPLLRASDWLDAYRRGPFAMFTLRTAIGEERVNLALRRLLRSYAKSDGPLPTSLDLYRELRAVTPEEHHGLLADLFERNTYWNLSTRSATAEPLGDGSWQVTFDLTAEKLEVDEEGEETAVPMNDLVEIGVYDTTGSKLIYLEPHRITAGSQELTIRVPSDPGRAGIDPRHLLIDPAWRNNVVDVKRNADVSPPERSAGVSRSRGITGGVRVSKPSPERCRRETQVDALTASFLLKQSGDGGSEAPIPPASAGGAMPALLSPANAGGAMPALLGVNA